MIRMLIVIIIVLILYIYYYKYKRIKQSNILNFKKAPLTLYPYPITSNKRELTSTILTSKESCLPICPYGISRTNYNFKGCLKLPDVNSPTNSVWTNTRTYNGIPVLTFVNDTTKVTSIDNAINIIRNMYPEYKYLYATFAEGDTQFIYFLVGNEDSFNPQYLYSCTSLNSDRFKDYYIGCKPDNTNSVCERRKLDSIYWSVYDIKPDQTQNCESCPYGKSVNYTTNSCDLLCPNPSEYFDGTFCIVNSDPSKVVNYNRTGLEDKCINNTYYDQATNSCKYCSVIEQINSTKNGCIPTCPPENNAYYNIKTNLCQTCRQQEILRYSFDQQKSFSDFKNSCINKCDSIQYILFRFVSPSGNPLVQYKYTIDRPEGTGLNVLLSGWSGSLVAPFTWQNAILPGSEVCNSTYSNIDVCYPRPVGRYRLELFVNNKYVRDFASDGFWDVNYNLLSILQSAFNLSTSINFPNFPYRISSIDASLSLDDNKQPKTFIAPDDGVSYLIFKFNIISPDSNIYDLTTRTCSPCQPIYDSSTNKTRPRISDQNNNCVVACPNSETYYDNDSKKCLTCPNSWQTSNSTQTGCDKRCQISNTYWDGTTCQSCGSILNTSTNKLMYRMVDQNNNCITPCPDPTTYYNLTTGTCNKCSSSDVVNTQQTGCENNCPNIEANNCASLTNSVYIPPNSTSLIETKVCNCLVCPTGTTAGISTGLFSGNAVCIDSGCTSEWPYRSSSGGCTAMGDTSGNVCVIL